MTLLAWAAHPGKREGCLPGYPVPRRRLRSSCRNAIVNSMERDKVALATRSALQEMVDAVHELFGRPEPGECRGKRRHWPRGCARPGRSRTEPRRGGRPDEPGARDVPLLTRDTRQHRGHADGQRLQHRASGPRELPFADGQTSLLTA